MKIAWTAWKTFQACYPLQLSISGGRLDQQICIFSSLTIYIPRFKGQLRLPFLTNPSGSPSLDGFEYVHVNNEVLTGGYTNCD